MCFASEAASISAAYPLESVSGRCFVYPIWPLDKDFGSCLFWDLDINSYLIWLAKPALTSVANKTTEKVKQIWTDAYILQSVNYMLMLPYNLMSLMFIVRQKLVLAAPQMTLNKCVVNCSIARIYNI